ncbi:peptidoglycan-recognition protein SC2-like [Frankliniella occidentalis]|uniref:Peptidoglycan-recognition protein SC2-like n=1 Tax=Frankliniella occidentalis TaxID=133901 RepID=A0A6J1T4K3_FRAOC|nr:peptidoglycan-recognition protein SC2-like [Frankliniella occidentalis]
MESRLPHLTYCVTLLPAAPAPCRHWLAALVGLVLGVGITALLAGVIILAIQRSGADEQPQTPPTAGDPFSERSNCLPFSEEHCLVSRDAWHAAPSGRVATLATPVDTVIVQQTTTHTCATREQCISATRKIQEFHMGKENNWSDIGYNFLVGGDGLVYSGRGWDIVGAHTKTWNNKSIGVGVIGSFSEVAAFPWQLSAMKGLLAWGVSKGKLTADYGVMGASQVQDTDSPGQRLMQDLRAWKHWRNYTYTTSTLHTAHGGT